ncbi:MAG: META domain-containing protein [Bacteroidota bacterium]|nr:META domain-containing protein [Bacteroidota bacterium]
MKSIRTFFNVTIAIIFFTSCSYTKNIASTEKGAANSNTPNASLKETYWKLTELMGKTVTMDSANQKEIHLVLKKDGTVQGFAGCNGFGGTYIAKNDFNISFSDMIHTMMACPTLDTENELFIVLKTVDNYYVTGDTLTLNKAKMAPMAKFVAIYLK